MLFTRLAPIYRSLGAAAALLLSDAALVGCGVADPLVVGHHETELASDDHDEPSDEGTDNAPSVPDLIGDERYLSCDSAPFRACGGNVGGTWEIVHTCNGVTIDEESLAAWSAYVGLPTETCDRAVTRLASSWTGHIIFNHQALTRDSRDTEFHLEMEMHGECLASSVAGIGPSSPMHGACSSLAEHFGMTCAVANADACTCSKQMKMSQSRVSSYWRSGNRIIVTDTSQGERVFEYCVQGDYMLYRQADDARYAIMRRNPNAPEPMLTLPR